MNESVAIEMSQLESTPKAPKPLKVQARNDRPHSKAPGLSDLTGFRCERERETRRERERETRRKKEEAINTVVEMHQPPAPAPAPAPASSSEIWL